MTNKWTKYNDAVVSKVHGPLDFYRDMYQGHHGKLFSRAVELIEKGEIIDRIVEGPRKAKTVQTPYIVANISKVIPEITAMFVSRSIGQIKSGLKFDVDQAAELNDETDDLIDGTNDNTTNGIIEDPQNEIIRQIVKDSRLNVGAHWSNVVQQQVDGGLVGVPWEDERGLRIEFKARDTYFPHADEMGADLVYPITDEEGKVTHVHVYRERIVDEGENLETSHFLYSVETSSDLRLIDDAGAADFLKIKTEDLQNTYIGRSRPFIEYWANDKTFMNPLGVSVLKGQESKQDEINWTMTRNAMVFERNGKPRIAIPKETMQELKDMAMDKFGSEEYIDHRDLEITTQTENGQKLEIIQIDISKIGTFENVKNYMKQMLMETQTSEKAVDFYMDGGGSAGAQSGTAKFYDLLISIMKSERIQEEYVGFLKNLFEGALRLANYNDPAVVIEEPDIMTKEMVPVFRKEVFEQNNLNYEKGTQSLETTVRNNNPNWSEEQIEAELVRIEEGSQSDNTSTLMTGRSTLLNMMDNRDAQGNVIPAAPVNEPVEE